MPAASVEAMASVVDEGGIHELVDLLRADGRTVVAPTVRDGVIVPAEVRSADELPIGWTDDQEGGHYRLEPTGTREHFAFASPSTSWKRHLYPERTLLVRTTRTADTIEVEQPVPDDVALAFVGIRSCDLAALDLLDRVFLSPDATDPTATTKRS